MHQARALSNKMNSDREDGHATALRGLTNFGHSAIPLHFLPETDFIYKDLNIVQK